MILQVNGSHLLASFGGICYVGISSYCVDEETSGRTRTFKTVSLSNTAHGPEKPDNT